MAGRAPIDRGPPAFVVLGDVGCEPLLSGVSDELSGVVVLVGSDRASPLLGGEPGQHVDRARPLREPVCWGQVRIDDQPGPVLDQQVTHVGQLRRRVVGLAVEQRLGIRG